MIVRLTGLLITGCLVVGAQLVADEVQPDVRSLYIEGYTDQLSYQPGDKIAFHVSTTATKWSLEIARLGAKTDTVLTKGDLAGTASAVPTNASSHGCKWPVAFELTVPDGWRSGYYEVTLRASDNGGEFIGRGRRTAESKLFFVVRPAKPASDTKILLQLTTNTYSAYNNWGGHSLYAFHARNKLQGTRVSFDRPLAGFFRQWELPFVAWAERRGYVLDYAVNSDLEFRPEVLKNYKLVLSVGHDEYWSAAMRDHLETFIGEGGNVAFFSGNTCCWQVRSEDLGRALACYKQTFVLDPVFQTKDHRLLATLWSHHLVARPENQLTGVGFLYGGYHRSHGQFMEGEAAFTVHQPDHWLFSGTRLKQGDKFGGKNTIVGYECDGCEMAWKDGVPSPTHRDGTPESFLILGTCPARWHPDDALWYDRFPRDADGKPSLGAAVMGVYIRGGTVFTAGTTDWAHGLTGEDPIVEQITRNVLERLGK